MVAGAWYGLFLVSPSPSGSSDLGVVARPLSTLSALGVRATRLYPYPLRCTGFEHLLGAKFMKLMAFTFLQKHLPVAITSD